MLIAGAATGVVTEAVLLAAVGSASLPSTVTVFVTAAARSAGASASIVIVAESPASRTPPMQLTVLSVTVQPGVVVVTFVNGAGTVSLTTHPLDWPGPLLVTVMVYSPLPPGMRPVGLVFVTARSVF